MNAFFKKGAVVLFQGDSITDAGRTLPEGHPLGEGYPRIISQVYQTLFPQQQVQFINRGVSGNRSQDLLARYDRDFLAVNPDFVSILIGINDVWRRFDDNDPTSAAQYEENCRTLFEKLHHDFPNTPIMVLEPFVLETLPDRALWQEDLDEKIVVLRRLARKYADYYVPLDGILASLCCKKHLPKELSEDGVHPTSIGHAYLAEAYLKTLGIL